MGTKTSFLELTLPDNGEYVDNWNSPINANFEDVDDWASGLHTDLVGTGSTTGTLKAGAASLQARLDAGLNDDGTPNLDNAPDFEALTRSEVYPVGSSADQGKRVRQRFNQAEVEVAKLRAAGELDRFGNTNSDTEYAGPEAMSGIAKLAAQYQDVSAGVQSPTRGFAPNTVVAGAVTGANPNYLSQSSNIVTIKDGTIINIDGFYFEVDGDMSVDFSTNITGITDTYYLYVTRNEAGYTGFDLTALYGNSLGGTYALDQRVIPANTTQRSGSPTFPTTGEISNTDLSTITTTGNTFLAYNVRAGDILRIVSTSNNLDGDYIIKTVAGDNELEIFGEFQLPPTVSTATNVQHYVWRPTTPAFGIRSDKTYQAGVVYVGEVDITAGNITAMRQYAVGGIYDTGWIALDVFSFSNTATIAHYLGVAPAQADVWVKENSTGRHVKSPVSAVEVQHADGAGGTTWAQYTIPTKGYQLLANDTNFGIKLLNPTGEATAPVLYDWTHPTTPAYVLDGDSTWSIRVILKR